MGFQHNMKIYAYVMSNITTSSFQKTSVFSAQMKTPGQYFQISPPWHPFPKNTSYAPVKRCLCLDACSFTVACLRLDWA